MAVPLQTPAMLGDIGSHQAAHSPDRQAALLFQQGEERSAPAADNVDDFLRREFVSPERRFWPPVFLGMLELPLSRLRLLDNRIAAHCIVQRNNAFVWSCD